VIGDERSGYVVYGKFHLEKYPVWHIHTGSPISFSC
jgi:hypothetical protein